MKFFAFLMSIYIIALGCFPCGDESECSDEAVQIISSAANHQGHQHSEEACTPFCSCACCAVSIFSQPLAAVKNIPVVSSPQKFYYNDSFHSYHFQSIWQPPKMV
jgi:hypothetical protein